MKKKFVKTPLNGVYVHGAKDVGTRTVNLLMGEHAGEYVRGDIMDANAVIQAFDELKGNIDSEHDSLEEVVDELHNLRDATDQGFEVFQEKAEEETANRIQGDKTLDEKIDQKADTTTLNEQVDALNTAISAKQDVGNYIPYDDQYEQAYVPDRTLRTIGNNIEAYSDASGNNRSALQPGNILVEKDGYTAKLNTEGLTIRNAYKDIYIDKGGLRIFNSTGNHNVDLIIQKQGISLRDGDNNHVLTSNSGTIDITQYALKSELPTKTSDLTNDSSFIVADVEDLWYRIENGLVFGLKNNGELTIDASGITSDVGKGFTLNSDGLEFEGRGSNEVPTADGNFIDISNYVEKSVYDEKIAALEARIAALEAKHTEVTA